MIICAMDLGSVIIDCESKHYNIGRESWRNGLLGMHTESPAYVA